MKKDPIHTEHIGKHQIHKTRQAPELVFHTAATYVMAGDPFSKNPEMQQDKAGEICQFCVQIPAKYVGKLRRFNIEEAFHKMMLATLEKLRENGAMAAGE